VPDERLAVDGGPPVRAAPYSTYRGLDLWGDEEAAAGLDVLRSRSLFRYYGPALGHRVTAFEEAFAARTGTAHAVGVTSGTTAIACALTAAGLPEGGEVVVPAVTFLACVNAVVMARGVATFCEVDDSLTLDPESLAERVTDRTWGVLPVHLANAAADMDAVGAVAARRGLTVVEDAAQAAGVTYRGRPVGGLGTAGAFSFQLEKNITAGEGGAVVTDDDDVADRVRRYQDQGGQFTTSRGAQRGEPAPAAFLGTNLRMTELAGAVLGVQLGRLDGMLARLRDVAATIRAETADLPWRVRRLPDEAGSGGDVGFLTGSRLEARAVAEALLAEGIPATVPYGGLPVYAHPAVRSGTTPWGGGGTRVERCPRSERLVGAWVSVALGAAMTDDDTADVVRALRKVAAVRAVPA
jgi:8-amino-3,8-dideoxy-alpha-D-manno-octulosonate transaminase